MEDLARVLSEFALTQGFRERAASACARWLRDEGVASDRLELRFERCCLVFASERVPNSYFETRLGVYSPRADDVAPRIEPRRIGHYLLITALDGTDEDDYRVLAESDNEIDVG